MARNVSSIPISADFGSEDKTIIDSHVLEVARDIATRSAHTGPTGYGAICTTGDGKIVVLRAPVQAEQHEAPTTIIEAHGDPEIADAIWRGKQAEYRLAKARGR